MHFTSILKILILNNNKRALSGPLVQRESGFSCPGGPDFLFICNWAIRLGSTPKTSGYASLFNTYETGLINLITSENPPPPLFVHENKKTGSLCRLRYLLVPGQASTYGQAFVASIRSVNTQLINCQITYKLQQYFNTVSSNLSIG